MLLELAYHYYTIIVYRDFTGYIDYIHEDSPLLDLAYRIAGL